MRLDRSWVVLSTLFILVMSSVAFAEPNVRTRKVAAEPQVTTEVSTRDMPQADDQSGTGLALFLGAGGSYFSVRSSDVAKEPNKSGQGFQGKGGLTFFNRSLAIELGMGWLQSTVESPQTTQTQGGTTTTRRASVMTRAGFAEFSPRLRLGKHFEIGPSAGVIFGTNASFGETGASSASPVLAGLKLAFDWQTRDLHFRLVGQGQQSLTIPERRVMMASVGLEIGIPLMRGQTVVRETQVKEVRQQRETEYVETEIVRKEIEKVEVVKEVLLFSFDDQIVHFEYDRAELAESSREFLKNLGEFPAGHPGLWEGLKIEGHTDTRGTPEYNQKLSDERAQAVLAVLAQAGVDSERMSASGVGLNSPLDRGPSDISHARNRRVEMSFTQVTDARALRDGINRIRFSTLVPMTCLRGRCR